VHANLKNAHRHFNPIEDARMALPEERS
jgi:hypothetical protein